MKNNLIILITLLTGLAGFSPKIRDHRCGGDRQQPANRKPVVPPPVAPKPKT